MEAPSVTAIGLMSGTSLDGVDAALIVTNGHGIDSRGASHFHPYPDALRARLRGALTRAQGLGFAGPLAEPFAGLEREVTAHHAQAVNALLAEARLAPHEVRIVGFHGQTILHRPDARQTIQIGSGAGLARAIGIDVINDFRSADVHAGGQGAPLVPVYHGALAQSSGLAGPMMVINIGGVANVTLIDEDGALSAFDTGPGNALIDDWAMRHTGRPVDINGALAAHGKTDEARVAAALQHPYFEKAPPKSLDRLAFSLSLVEGLSAEDGAATLTAFTAAAIAQAARHLRTRPLLSIVCGGGRHNPVLMAELRRRLGNAVFSAEDQGWRGDMIEAEAFAFLAVRSLYGLPLSLPATTGVKRPMTGGTLHLGRDK